MADELTRAKHFIEQCDEWFPRLREVYKENLAIQFEGQTPNQTEVEKIGAKLAVMKELLRELSGLISNADVQQEDEQ